MVISVFWADAFAAKRKIDRDSDRIPDNFIFLLRDCRAVGIQM
jgi:hypothetical protein